MENYSGSYRPTKTTEFLINLNKFVFIFGLPNFWVEELDFPNSVMKLIRLLSKFGNWSVFAMILSEYCAFVTQKNLTDRQSSDMILFVISHSIITGFRVRMTHQESQIRDVMYKLGIQLKEIYNDVEVEEQMIKKSKFFSWALILNCVMSIIMYTIEAVLRVIRTGETFNTIIPAWPDVEDSSTLGNVGRTIFYIFWWIYLSRIFAVYSLVICLTIAVSHQFKNLNSYFGSLSNIFENDQLTQREKELEYERALKVGIKMHSETLTYLQFFIPFFFKFSLLASWLHCCILLSLWNYLLFTNIRCTSEIQAICRDVFSGQIIFNLTMLILLMYQMVNSARNLTNDLTIVVTALTILCSTGFFMWNAGDITVEAEVLPTAIFGSGWENCWLQTSVRVRKLIVIAMLQAQEPVVLTGLGVIALSYQSYVSIVKSSYSVFSVIY